MRSRLGSDRLVTFSICAALFMLATYIGIGDVTASVTDCFEGRNLKVQCLAQDYNGIEEWDEKDTCWCVGCSGSRGLTSCSEQVRGSCTGYVFRNDSGEKHYVTIQRYSCFGYNACSCEYSSET